MEAIWANWITECNAFFGDRSDSISEDILLKIYMYFEDCWYFPCAFDARYPTKGFHSNECTFTILDCNSQKIVDIIHIHKKRTFEHHCIKN